MSILIEQKIIEYLKQKKVVKPKEIEQVFNLTLSTTRRYLVKLEEKNMIRRTFGEIIYNDDLKSNVDANANNKILENINQKKEIAKKAVKLVGQYKTIYLDSGSSCYFLLDYLDKDVVIYTNSILNATRAINLGFKNVNIIGGTIKEGTLSIVDIDMDFINKINFPIAFMGVNGINEKGILTTPEKREGITKKILASKSDLVVVLAEKQKINQQSLYDFTPINKKILVVTDHDKLINLENENLFFIYTKGERNEN
ncbi:DeoR/GlpR transcriptional regulator [Malacoplasma penetrans]|nr:DeoR/GlpR family DNA-binding transcription regulator [Malacoplasma penetrans]RXY96735.1 DeoR/GlpR transcriptional regulator [Malacoplasma penetrans]